MVTVEEVGPGDVGANSTTSLHFLLGPSCAGQVDAPWPRGNPNICGLVSGTVASGLPKVIGGPCPSEFLNFIVMLAMCPTFTSPKLTGDGLTFSDPGTPVGVDVGVGVGVSVEVGVAVGVPPVAVAVGVGVGAVAVALGVGVGVGPVPPNAITKLYALTVPMPVAKSHPVPVGYAGANSESDADSTPFLPDGV